MSIIDLAFRISIADDAQVENTTAALAHWIDRLAHHNAILGRKITMFFHTKNVVQRRNELAFSNPGINIWQYIQNTASLGEDPVLQKETIRRRSVISLICYLSTVFFSSDMPQTSKDATIGLFPSMFFPFFFLLLTLFAQTTGS